MGVALFGRQLTKHSHSIDSNAKGVVLNNPVTYLARQRAP
jgi:hypothetical protein